MMLCQCPKLTPLQSRFLASVVTLAILALIYWSLSEPHFAYAAELDVDGSGLSRGGDDHNWHRIAQETLIEDGIDLNLGGGEGHDDGEANMLEARAASLSTISENNVGNLDNIVAGSTTVWKYPKSVLESQHAEQGPGLPANVRSVGGPNDRHAELRKRENFVEEEDELDEYNDLEERRAFTVRRIYVSINTCIQPEYVGSGTQTGPPPQLTLYVATSADNTSPGPDTNADSQVAISLHEGFAKYAVVASGDWYIAVSAPNLPNSFSGVWNYELAVSIDAFYHSLGSGGSNMFLVDSDTTGALLVTNNLTQADPGSSSYEQWMSLTAPYILFANNVNFTKTMGMSKSYCGLSKTSQIVGNQSAISGDTTNVQMEMITRGLGNKPKEQFYVTYLNSSSKYHAYLARAGNSTASGNGVVGGGGKVWQNVTFSTKADANCALLFNLTFCDEVAYAAPSTPDFVANYTNFQFFYDNYTRFFYQNFNYSLQQIPCHMDPAAQYSLAKNCSDCAKAYKEWLCAVSIPRCEDFSNDADFLQARNVGQPFFNGTTLSDEYLNTSYIPMPGAPTLPGTVAFIQTHNTSIATNQSRNPEIDKQIAPGPYKEVLPCEDLCYSLVQSCPAALGFGCPYPGRGLERGYGTRHGNGNGTLSCSFLGAYVYTGGAGCLQAQVFTTLFVACLTGLALMTF